MVSGPIVAAGAVERAEGPTAHGGWLGDAAGRAASGSLNPRGARQRREGPPQVGLKHPDGPLQATMAVRIDKILEGKPQLRSLGYPHYDDAPIQNEVVMLSSS